MIPESPKLWNEWPVLTPAQLLRDLFGSKALLASASTGLLSEDKWSTLFRPREDSASDYRWSDADVPLLDEAYAGLGPRLDRQRKPRDPEVRTFGHIVIDETQDHAYGTANDRTAFIEWINDVVGDNATPPPVPQRIGRKY